MEKTQNDIMILGLMNDPVQAHVLHTRILEPIGVNIFLRQFAKTLECPNSNRNIVLLADAHLGHRDLQVNLLAKAIRLANFEVVGVMGDLASEWANILQVPSLHGKPRGTLTMTAVAARQEQLADIKKSADQMTMNKAVSLAARAPAPVTTYLERVIVSEDRVDERPVLVCEDYIKTNIENDASFVDEVKAVVKTCLARVEQAEFELAKPETMLTDVADEQEVVCEVLEFVALENNFLEHTEVALSDEDILRARIARIDQERQERECEERLMRAELLRMESERLAREEALRLEAERIEFERLEALRVEVERLDAQRMEEERAAQLMEEERLEALRVEGERLEAQRLEEEQLEKLRIETIRIEAERDESERLEKERLEVELFEAERMERELIEAEQVRREDERTIVIEQARVEAERMEAEWLAGEEQARREAERAAQIERFEVEMIEAQRVERERNEEALRLEGVRLDLERANALELEVRPIGESEPRAEPQGQDFGNKTMNIEHKGPERDHAPSDQMRVVVIESIKPQRVQGRVRSGQLITHSGDIIVEGSVHPGGELVATGDIHIYGKGAGRLLAGVSGDLSACIYVQNFDAELISIAGKYYTFDNPDDYRHWRGRSLKISLKDGALTFEAMEMPGRLAKAS